MSIFDGQRLAKEFFLIDTEGMRKGRYADAYFNNIATILSTLAMEGYTFQGIGDLPEIDCSTVQNGDLNVEMQFFTRRKPFSIVAGVDEVLAMLADCTGYYDEAGKFIETYRQLEIKAVHDGIFVEYEGDPKHVRPVLRIKGRYRDFARLETTILGVLSETTRVATNVYNVLLAAGGKDILFFPARFTHYKLQSIHGYAYNLAVQAYNQRYGKDLRPFISTDEQGLVWDGKGGGTVAHASIACFLGDTVETMMQFARVMPVEMPRIALVDFHNDCIGETLAVMKSMYTAYWKSYRTGEIKKADQYKLFAVRLDTSGDIRDVSIPATGDKEEDCGVNPRLIIAVRKAIDSAYRQWELPEAGREAAKAWCEQIKIIVTGGFDLKKITRFEALGVPADIYGVGSALLENSKENGTNNDFTADIVRVKVGDNWHPMCKVGRQACDLINESPSY